MKTNQALTGRLLFLLVLALAVPQIWADANPPERLTYQGYLVDGNGDPLGVPNPKNHDVVFRIYTDQGAGLLRWTEQQTVTVDKGYFSVLLGEGTQVGSEKHPPLSMVFGGADASDRYVEITVKGIGPGGNDVTIQPRLRLLTSPYSFLARNALEAAKVNGTNITGTIGDASLSPNVALLGRNPQRFSGNIGINTTTGPGGNNLQIGNTFHPAAGFGLVVNSSTYGANIQISRSGGQGGNGLIIDNSANGDMSTIPLLCRNNVASSPQNVMWVRGDGFMLALGLGFTAHPNGAILAGTDWINYNSQNYHFFNVNGVGKAHITHNEARFHVPLYAQSFTPTSDRNQKENFVDVDRREVLQKVVQLPLTTWNFKAEKSVRHMGPVSQDFRAAFGLGKDDKGIATVDADGVAFAAIQGLHQILGQKDEEIQNLKREMQELRQMVEGLIQQTSAASR